MMRKELLSSAIVLAGGLCASVALANPDDTSYSSTTGAKAQQSMGTSARQESARFDKLDANGDGVLSKSELNQADADISIEHSTLDTDDDGQVDRTEFAVFERMNLGGQKGGSTQPEY